MSRKLLVLHESDLPRLHDYLRNGRNEIFIFQMYLYRTYKFNKKSITCNKISLIWVVEYQKEWTGSDFGLPHHTLRIFLSNNVRTVFKADTLTSHTTGGKICDKAAYQSLKDTINQMRLANHESLQSLCNLGDCFFNWIQLLFQKLK